MAARKGAHNPAHEKSIQIQITTSVAVAVVENAKRSARDKRSFFIRKDYGKEFYLRSSFGERSGRHKPMWERMPKSGRVKRMRQ